MPRPYEAPLALIRAAIDQAARTTLAPVPGHAEALTDTADAVLEGIARIAREVLSPINASGDAAGSRLTAEGVVTPAGFREAYGRFRADGWPTLCAPEEFGGQGLPMLLGAAATETWGGANLAFAMCPEAVTGAVEALRIHAAPELCARYLPRIVSGEWTASMCLSEPQAGSDLSTVRTLAKPDGDAWRLEGRKIFISWGDHDLAANIVHLVLARTPDAPPGTRGLSLFLVPKWLPADGAGVGSAGNADGSTAHAGNAGASGDAGGQVLNDIAAVSLEHKMGIHASPTCVMQLGDRGGARGWLVGSLHSGLACLFTMMNHMRLGVGLHSTGLAERAWQLARVHAEERRQGRDASGAQRPIIEHWDVRRMLLTMKALTHAARCLAYQTAATLDLAYADVDAPLRARAHRRLALLTPLVKAWCSDVAVEVASLGVQVHGGAGYVSDSEISQVYRDARIGPIFEGTNYIQAQDLLERKVIRDGGAALEDLLADVERAARELESHARAPGATGATSATGSADASGAGDAGRSGLSVLSQPLLVECGELRAAARRLIESSRSQPQLTGCVAYPFLQWLAWVAGGWQWALAAKGALRRGGAEARNGSGSGGGDGVGTGLARELVDCARFYGAHLLPRARVHAAQVASGTDILATPQPAEI